MAANELPSKQEPQTDSNKTQLEILQKHLEIKKLEMQILQLQQTDIPPSPSALNLDAFPEYKNSTNATYTDNTNNSNDCDIKPEIQLLLSQFMNQIETNNNTNNWLLNDLNIASTSPAMPPIPPIPNENIPFSKYVSPDYYHGYLVDMSIQQQQQQQQQQKQSENTDHKNMCHTNDSDKNNNIKKYGCPECPKTFKHHSNLKIHSIVHTPEALVCSYCDKKFARKPNLKQHERVHTGERPFECGICKRKFKQKHSLTDHIKIHTGQKPFVCHFCNKAFKIKHSFTLHVRTHNAQNIAPY